jgi:hypothetical protein
MKIEIEIPLDENEWEVVSIEALPHYAVTDEISTYKNYVTIKKKQNWKDKIVFPGFLLEGNWIARDKDESIWIYLSEPEKYKVFENCWGFKEECSPLDSRFHDLSFLPQEFWDCKPEDSLVQVTHEVKG